MPKSTSCIFCFFALNMFAFFSSSALAQNSYMLTPNKVCRLVEEPYKKFFEDYDYPTFSELDDCLDQEGAVIPNSPTGLREKAHVLRNAPVDLLEGFRSEKNVEAQSINDQGAVESYTISESQLKDRLEVASEQKAKAMVEADDTDEEADAQEDFEKFKLGIGIAFTKLHGESIEDVDIRDDRIVIDKERSHRGSFMLESHKFFTYNRLSRMFGNDTTTVGVGPFITVSIADTDGGDPFSAYGVGLMMGFKDRKGSGSWNFGFGYFVDTEAKKLRPGLKAGDTTTVQDTDDLLVERDQGGVMLIVSTSWD